MDFDRIAQRYERDSLVQKSAAERLFAILAIGGNEDVLDLGCGVGNLTRKIRGMTTGGVAGVDPAAGMVREAWAGNAGLDIALEVMAAEELAFAGEFDVIFCNSAFQWFTGPAMALNGCRRALRPGGRIGIQAPARSAYSPNFVAAIDDVATDPRTRETFATFHSPWFFLESVDDYRRLFEAAGFTVPFVTISEEKSYHHPQEVITIFESGAAAGYLNPGCYDAPLSEAYRAAFREIVRAAFTRQSREDGLVELVFNRVYLVGVREGSALASE
ncbi:class I SAM-dependent methyltransferase [Geobacter grbiciae]|uniref:class I SAM-dependent methyltransferase n=1 Tax=Geobacter grbiciae TaxID=155042 RepID=UPI001C02A7D3|nr:class I SAM-dependent methyltransferase [Geobacter grbiciae]MBT1074970.1 methyltransferase domain-containing protein [Geobacter grbiciae]